MVNDELDGIKVAFDDERSVADAGVLVAATLSRRLGVEALVNDWVDLGCRVWYFHFRPGAQGALVGARDAARRGQHR